MGIIRVLASICARFAITVGAALAQPRGPALGKPGEPIKLRVVLAQLCRVAAIELPKALADSR